MRNCLAAQEPFEGCGGLSSQTEKGEGKQRQVRECGVLGHGAWPVHHGKEPERGTEGQAQGLS